MSILSDLVNKKITFSQAAAEAVSWAEALISHDPTVTNNASAVLADVKQGASNAVEAADSALSAHYGEIVVGTETLLEGVLAKVTNGASIPFNPFVSDGIDKLAAAAKAQADAWALQAKAKLVPAKAS